MPLSDLRCKGIIKEAVANGKPLKKADGRGLLFKAQPTGSAYWQYKYRYLGKEKLFSLGVYPEVSLSEAREKHAAAHKLVSENKDPLQLKKDGLENQKREATNTFGLLADEWYKHNLEGWNARYAKTLKSRLEKDLLPALGAKPIREIRPPDLLRMVRAIEAREAYELASRALQTTSQIMRYAVVTGRLERDITPDLRGALKPYQKSHHAAMEPKDLPDFLKKLERNEARLFPETRILIELMLLTFVRTGELIKADWREFDLENALWSIPAARMKMRNDHLVPLSRQAIALLKQLQETNGNSGYVFPSKKGKHKHVSNGAILMALDRMNYRGIHTGHGFRALAMTTIKEKLKYTHDIVDRQLAHAPRNAVDRAYDRAKYLDERTLMMQKWADYIDGLKAQIINKVV